MNLEHFHEIEFWWKIYPEVDPILIKFKKILNFLEQQISSQNFEFQSQLKKYVKSTTSKHQVFILGCKVAVKHTVGNQSSELVTVGQLFYDSQSI